VRGGEETLTIEGVLWVGVSDTVGFLITTSHISSTAGLRRRVNIPQVLQAGRLSFMQRTHQLGRIFFYGV